MGVSLSLAQTAVSQKDDNVNDYKRLYFLNLQYTQSWLRSDTATYNQLLWAEDFVHQNGADGILYPKKALLALFGKPRFDKITYFFPENVMIQFISKEAAMVFASPPLQLVGQSEETRTQYNDVYVKRNGEWICVSANITPLSKSGDAPATFTKLPEPTELISYHSGSENDKSILTELNAKHAEAFQQSKSELLENILADDFILLSSNGRLYKKKEVLTQIKTQRKNNSVDAYSIENLNIRFVASDVAMIHAAIVTRLKDGKTTAIQCNDIYAKRGDRWVCVSGNNTPIRN
jgi:hypothetical protein